MSVAKPSPVQALSVVIMPEAGVEPLTQHGDAVISGNVVEIAKAARSVGFHGFTHQVVPSVKCN